MWPSLSPNISLSQAPPTCSWPQSSSGSYPQLKLATKMARPFIASEAAATSWVGRQGSGFPLPSGFDWEVSLQSANCLDAYPPRPCFGYNESHHSYWSEALSISNTGNHNLTHLGSPTNILQKTFWVSGSNEPRVYGKFQASVPGELQKSSPQSSTPSHRSLLRKWLSTPGGTGIIEPKGDRDGLPTVQWESLIAEHLPSLQEQGFQINIHIQQEKIQFSGPCRISGSQLQSPGPA